MPPSHRRRSHSTVSPALTLVPHGECSPGPSLFEPPIGTIGSLPHIRGLAPLQWSAASPYSPIPGAVYSDYVPMADRTHADLLSATELATDLSHNFHIGSVTAPTPRRSLFGPAAARAVTFNGSANPSTLPTALPRWNNQGDTPARAAGLALDMTPQDSSTPMDGFTGPSQPINTPTGASRPARGSASFGGPDLLSFASPNARQAQDPRRMIFQGPSASTPSLVAYPSSQDVPGQARSGLKLGYPRRLGVDGRASVPVAVAVPAPAPSQAPALSEALGPAIELSPETSDDTFGRESFAVARRYSRRPPTKVRRTQSMFQSTEAFLNQQMTPDVLPLAGPVTEDAAATYGLLGAPECPIPTFTVKQDPFCRIHRETLVKLLDGDYSSSYDTVVVIDCRFEYEYEGGHIAGAININDKAQLEEEFLQSSQGSQKYAGTNVLLVFHCEYSAYRGPLMATHLRQCDRKINQEQYPHLNFPDIAILDGGYSHFYELHNTRCEPQNYVGMNDDLHRITCEREMERFRNYSRIKKHSTISSFLDCGGSPGRAAFRFPLQQVASNALSSVKR